MLRLNLGLESRENVISSLTKVDRKSKLVELPASWPSQSDAFITVSGVSCPRGKK